MNAVVITEAELPKYAADFVYVTKTLRSDSMSIPNMIFTLEYPLQVKFWALVDEIWYA